MKPIWITVYPHGSQRPYTQGVTDTQAMKDFLRPLNCEAAIRDHTGRLRFRFVESASSPGDHILASPDWARLEQMEREKQSSPAATPPAPALVAG